MVAGGEGITSETAIGIRLHVGADGVPWTFPGQLYEGGRRFRFGASDYTFVVPEGALLRTAQAGGQGVWVVVLLDAATTLKAYADPYAGEIFRETFWDEDTRRYMVRDHRAGEVFPARRDDAGPPPPGSDSGAFFERIQRSVRRDPLP